MAAATEAPTVQAGGTTIQEIPVPVRATGDPQVLGWLVFVVGSVCLGLELVGFVPAAVLGAPLAIILGATALGLLISAIWAAYLGQTFVAGAFGGFAGFWFSYTALVLGLQHNWFLIPAEAVTDTVVAFLVAWAVGIFLLTAASIRLPSLYTLDIALVDAALVILVFANHNGSAALTKVAGLVVFAFAAIGAYIWLSSASTSLGGPAYPLGRPVKS